MEGLNNLPLRNTLTPLKDQICLEDSKVLEKIPHYYKRKIREALEIERFDNNVNRDDGLKLKEAWKPVVHHIKTNQPPQREFQYNP